MECSVFFYFVHIIYYIQAVHLWMNSDIWIFFIFFFFIFVNSYHSFFFSPLFPLLWYFFDLISYFISRLWIVWNLTFHYFLDLNFSRITFIWVYPCTTKANMDKHDIIIIWHSKNYNKSTSRADHNFSNKLEYTVLGAYNQIHRVSVTI